MDINQLLTEMKRLPDEWHKAGTVPYSVLEGIAKHASDRPILHSMEVGSGKSTLLFSHISKDHKVFSVDAGNSITVARNSPLINQSTVEFIEGPSQITLPSYKFQNKLQLAFIDGPHGYPFPEMEYYRIYPHLEERGLLIVDDIHIPTIHNLFNFLKEEEMFSLIEVIEDTAFFERTKSPTFATTEDGWWLQNYNKRRFPVNLKKQTEPNPETNVQGLKSELCAQDEFERSNLIALIERIRAAKAYRLLRFFGRWKWFDVLANRCLKSGE